MYYIYSRHLETGKESFITTADNQKEMIERITALYVSDSKSVFKGEYYYFFKIH